MSYGLLLSHTFPGLMLEIEAIIAFQFFTKLDISFYSLLFPDHAGAYSTSRLVLTLTGMLIVATILGFLIDGLHHWIYDRKVKDEANYEIYRHVKSVQQMQDIHAFR